MLTKSELKKTFIVEKSKALFIEKGFQTVTMTDVVEACDISRGGLYRYYKNTVDIFLDVLEMAHETGDFNVKQAMENNQPATNILETFFAEQKQDLLDQKETLTIAIYEFLFMHKYQMKENMMEERFKQAEVIFSQLIQYGIDKGEFKHVTPHLVARHIILLLEGIRVSGQVMSIDERLLEEQFQFIKACLLKGNDH